MSIRNMITEACVFFPRVVAVGHGWPGALPHHHVVVLPRRPRHHRGVRRDRPGVLQQRQAVAA